MPDYVTPIIQALEQHNQLQEAKRARQAQEAYQQQQYGLQQQAAEAKQRNDLMTQLALREAGAQPVDTSGRYGANLYMPEETTKMLYGVSQPLTLPQQIPTSPGDMLVNFAGQQYRVPSLEERGNEAFQRMLAQRLAIAKSDTAQDIARWKQLRDQFGITFTDPNTGNQYTLPPASVGDVLNPLVNLHKATSEPPSTPPPPHWVQGVGPGRQISVLGINPQTMQPVGPPISTGLKPPAAETARVRIEAAASKEKAAADDVQQIADAIESGNQPPELSRLYGKSAAVRAELQRRGFNVREAQQDWMATQRWISSLNSGQQLRLRQATQFAYESLDLIDKLSQELSAKVPRTRFPVINKAALAAAKSGALGQDAQVAATNLDIQILDLQSELATVYQGGNSPTDRGLKRAHDLLASNWTEKQLQEAVDLARKNLRIRLNSILNTGPVTLHGMTSSGGAPAPQAGAAPMTAEDWTKKHGRR